MTVQSRIVTLTNSQPLLRSQQSESSYNSHWLLLYDGRVGWHGRISLAFYLHLALTPCGNILFWSAHPDMQDNLRFLTLTHINTPTTANIDRHKASCP